MEMSCWTTCCFFFSSKIVATAILNRLRNCRGNILTGEVVSFWMVWHLQALSQSRQTGEGAWGLQTQGFFSEKSSRISTSHAQWNKQSIVTQWLCRPSHPLWIKLPNVFYIWNKERYCWLYNEQLLQQCRCKSLKPITDSLKFFKILLGWIKLLHFTVRSHFAMNNEQ